MKRRRLRRHRKALGFTYQTARCMARDHTIHGKDKRMRMVGIRKQ